MKSVVMFPSKKCIARSTKCWRNQNGQCSCLTPMRPWQHLSLLQYPLPFLRCVATRCVCVCVCVSLSLCLSVLLSISLNSVCVCVCLFVCVCLCVCLRKRCHERVCLHTSFNYTVFVFLLSHSQSGPLSRLLALTRSIVLARSLSDDCGCVCVVFVWV
jgi:hypothetical protein